MAKLNTDFMRAASAGLELAVPVLLLAFFGYKIDEWYNIRPWGMVIGLFLGFIAGIWNVYKFVIGGKDGNP